MQNKFMINQIKENVWQLHFTEFGSCVYVIKLQDKNILIDTGSLSNKEELILDLEKLNLKLKDVDILILTHNHYDHVENSHLFTNAKIYSSKKEFQEEEIKEIEKLKIPEFKIIPTPGHSRGSFCILYQDILFSGDTIFHNKGVGRTDLEGGSYQELLNSVEKLSKIKYKILCPGHI